MNGDDQRLLALAAAGRRFAACNSIAELAPVAVELGLHILGASSASLARIEPGRGILRVLRNAGELADWEEPEPVDETYDIDDFPLLMTLVEDARPWFGGLDDPETGAAHHELLRQMGMHSSISLPIVVGSTVWGELGAARRGGLAPFSPADAAAGEAFVGLLGVAITRVEERDELHALAFDDALTGLANRRAIDDRLELLFAREPLAEPVSIVHCDVDGLKRLNDAYGHEAGDRLLREVATLLTRVAGTFDRALAARLGGDEFCLLVEGATAEEVGAATDRLVSEAAQLPMGGGLSCGWAVADKRPGDAVNARTAARALVRLADAAQYRAKRAGRDAVQVRVTEPRTGIEVTQRVVEVALAAVRAAGPRVEDRLEAATMAVVEAVDASAWSVSVSHDGGPIEIVRSAYSRRLGREEDQAMLPGTSFDRDDYPASDAALAGGVFHATMDTGHPTERAFLAAYGHDEIVGAGAVQDERTAWLVEIAGDALSQPLVDHLPVLRSMVAYAVDNAGATLIADSGDLNGPSAAP